MHKRWAVALALLALGNAGCGSLAGPSGPELDYKTATDAGELLFPAELGGPRRGRLTVPPPSGCADCEVSTTVPSIAKVPEPSTIAETIGPEAVSDAVQDEQSMSPELSATTQAEPIESVVAMRADAARWVEINSSIEPGWSGVLSFLDSQGFTLAHRNNQQRLITTEWIDNSSALSSASLKALLQRDLPLDMLGEHRFSLRLESRSSRAMRIFVHHEAMVPSPSGARKTVSEASLAERLLIDLLAWFGVGTAEIRSASAS